MFILIFKRNPIVIKAGKVISKTRASLIIEELNSGAISTYRRTEIKTKDFSSREKLIKDIKSLQEQISTL